MAETQQLQLPRRLEPYGTADWLNVTGTRGLHNMVQLEQPITDGIVTIFDAWKEDGGVDSYRFNPGVRAIEQELLDSSIVEVNNNMAIDGYTFVAPSGRYWQRPISMGPAVGVENDGSPRFHGTVIHIDDRNRGMTTDERYNDTRIHPEGGTPGLYPDKRWVDRVLACAGLLALRVEKYVEAAQASDDFMGDFFQQRIEYLQQMAGKYGLTVHKTEGAKPHIAGGVVPYEGIVVCKEASDIVEVRIPTEPGTFLPGSGVEYGYGRGRYEKIIEAVHDDRKFTALLKDLVYLGGVDGPVQDLVTKPTPSWA